MANDIKKLRRLMITANILRKENPVILRGASLSQSQALKYAWWFEKFRNMLSKGIYRFSYMKKDGTIREATGTLSNAFIPTDKLPKGTAKIINYETFSYYDLVKNEWRSFRLDNFVGFVEEVKEKRTKRENHADVCFYLLKK